MKAKDLILHYAFSLGLVRWMRGKLHSFTLINCIEVILSPLGLIKYLLTSLQARIEWGGGQTTYDLSIVAIAKDEGLYINEWIAFNKAVGVDHIYLYDNDSTDGLREKISSYVDEGYVSYHLIRGKKRQCDAYNEAIDKYKYESKYMIFIDVDEFVFPVSDQERLVDVIDNYFKDNKQIGGLSINWLLFGSSGKEQYDDDLVIERFTKRAKYEFDANKQYKVVVDPRKCFSFICPHYPMYLVGYYMVSDDGAKLKTDRFSSEYKTLRCNHYFTKSFEEFSIKRNRGMADRNQIRDMSDFERHDKNDEDDYEILRYLSDVKKLLC